MNPYFPILIMIVIGVGLGLALSAIAALVGPSVSNKVKKENFECGVPQVDAGREKMSVKFYLTAILFILFDIETVFLFLWARSFDALGWFGIIEVGIFLFILVTGYIYVLKRGALEWD